MYIGFFLWIMIKGIFKAYNPKGTFFTLEHFYHHFTEYCDIAFLLILFPHRDTVLVVLFVFLNLNLYIKIG